MWKKRLFGGLGLVVSSFIIFIVAAGVADAHFTMVFPGRTLNPTADDFMAELGERKTLWILWGHPYEHILFDCPKPTVWVRDPQGNVEELLPTKKTVEGKRAWEVSFMAVKRGDYILYLDLKDEEHKTFDHLKTIIHCDGEIWKGWNASTGQRAEIIPYTRPYGLEEGFVFSGRAIYRGKAMKSRTVEIEKYYPKDVAEKIVPEAEEKFQPDPSSMYTRVTTTNDKGEFCFTLDEPGIWYIAVYGPEEEGLEQRAVIQVPVREAFP